jgi:hypothetical protein
MNGLFHRDVNRAVIFAAALVFSSILAVQAAVFEVGPGQNYQAIGDVPWESLKPGDTVLIHWRPEPYREKWVIAGSGTAKSPITVRGVPGANNSLPVIDGNGAKTRRTLEFWNEGRGVIKIGGARGKAAGVGRYIVLENLDVRGGRPPYTFMAANGSTQNYLQTAAAIYVERGEHIVIRNCAIHDCGNGLFLSSGDRDTSKDILIERNHIYDNGNAGRQSEHNSYTEAQGIVFQFNWFGPLRPGCPGINLKDRSSGAVVRCNWIEGGNLELSLVEAEDSQLLREDPEYRRTFVYGNVIIEPNGDGLGLIARYGGDSRKTETFRKGTLFFYNNTVVSRRTDGTMLLKLSTDAEQCDFRNNIVYLTNPGRSLRFAPSPGKFTLSHNWFKSGSDVHKRVGNDQSTLTGDAPGFVDAARGDFRLATGSPCIGAGAELPSGVRAVHPVDAEYVTHQISTRRLNSGGLDLGAFGFLGADRSRNSKSPAK